MKFLIIFKQEALPLQFDFAPGSANDTGDPGRLQWMMCEFPFFSGALCPPVPTWTQLPAQQSCRGFHLPSVWEYPCLWPGSEPLSPGYLTSPCVFLSHRVELIINHLLRKRAFEVKVLRACVSAAMYSTSHLIDRLARCRILS